MPLFLEEKIHYCGLKMSSWSEEREAAVITSTCCKDTSSVSYYDLGELLPCLSSASSSLSMRIMEPTSWDSEWNNVWWLTWCQGRGKHGKEAMPAGVSSCLCLCSEEQSLSIEHKYTLHHSKFYLFRNCWIKPARVQLATIEDVCVFTSFAVPGVGSPEQLPDFPSFICCGDFLVFSPEIAWHVCWLILC